MLFRSRRTADRPRPPSSRWLRPIRPRGSGTPPLCRHYTFTEPFSYPTRHPGVSQKVPPLSAPPMIYRPLHIDARRAELSNESGTHHRWVQALPRGPHPLRGYPAYVSGYAAPIREPIPGSRTGSARGAATRLGEANWIGTSGPRVPAPDRPGCEGR